MSGILPFPTFELANPVLDSWIAVTPNSEDDQPHVRSLRPNLSLTADLALAVEGLRIHEHEESFPSEGEDEVEEDMFVPPSEDSEDDIAESSDEETILAPRTRASLAHPTSSEAHPVSEEALRARCHFATLKTDNSLSTFLKSKDATVLEEYPSPRRMTSQGPMGMESLSIVGPEEFVTRSMTSSKPTSSRASSSKSTSSRLGKKSHSKRSSRSPSKSRPKDNGAQVYALWTAAITAGFLVGFGAGYAWKEYLAGGTTSEDVRRVGCAWCGEGKR